MGRERANTRNNPQLKFELELKIAVSKSLENGFKKTYQHFRGLGVTHHGQEVGGWGGLCVCVGGDGSLRSLTR